MDMDWTQFINPAASPFGWSAPSQGILSPQVQNSPWAPVTGGTQPPAPNPPALPPASAPPVAPPAPNPPAMPSGGGNGAGGNFLGGLIRKLTGQGQQGGAGGGSGWQNMMQKVAMGMLQPQQMQAPQIQTAKPVGPVTLPGSTPPTAGPQSNPNQPPANANLAGYGMLGRYGF